MKSPLGKKSVIIQKKKKKVKRGIVCINSFTIGKISNLTNGFIRNLPFLIITMLEKKCLAENNRHKENVLVGFHNIEKIGGR